jgi:nuclear pore complex protein Nup155
LYEKREKCYDVIFDMLQNLDALEDGANSPSLNRLRQQTYELVYGSDDELFHQALYNWYIRQGQADRLLEVSTPVNHC